MENFDYEKLENSYNKYEKLSDSMQEIFNLKTKNMLYFVFGFNKNDVIEQLEKDYNLNIKNLISIGYGGYIEKENVKKFNNINKYINGIKKEFCKDYYNCCGLYYHRLWDYESRIGFDGYENALNDLLFCMGVNSIDDLDKKLLKMLIVTEKHYNNEFDKIN